MAKRKRAKRPADLERAPHPFRYFIQGIPKSARRSVDAWLIAVAVAHLFFFLVLLAAIVDFRGSPTARPFGEQSRRASKAGAPQPEAKKAPVSRVGSMTFAAFTLVAWGVVVWARRAMSRRAWRILLIMLTPGTLTAAYLVAMVFRR